VEVHDQGGPRAGTALADGQNGRGLLIVDRLARAWGRTGNETADWITWFEMDHPWPQLATPGAPGGQQPS
jgi:hypothetical protein